MKLLSKLHIGVAQGLLGVDLGLHMLIDAEMEGIKVSVILCFNITRNNNGRRRMACICIVSRIKPCLKINILNWIIWVTNQSYQRIKYGMPSACSNKYTSLTFMIASYAECTRLAFCILFIKHFTNRVV